LANQSILIMPIIKDANYWKEYNQKRREYLSLKKRQSRAKLKGLVVDNLNNRPVVDISNSVVDQNKEIKVVDMLKIVDIKPETVVDKMVVDRESDNLVVDRVPPVSKIVVDLEAYNAEVYKRASVLTKDPAAFFTFPDGRKIIRTVCGCNPTTKAFYTWCLDACQYFTSWRNSQKYE